ncbi:hypothetical protein EI555_014095 [Monodon monoceros]|uniref:Uncharacterized protein n=1 Tax=Monodon monoceros TaxID=40151 RepID=A0A4U1FAM3_MONMO|nr:hypothetical protein EI555_014095 [Monodon monoceros]
MRRGASGEEPSAAAEALRSSLCIFTCVFDDLAFSGCLLFPGEIMKRGRLPSSSEDSDDNGMVTRFRASYKSGLPQCAQSISFGVFRTDLITAMKLHDSYQLNPDEYYVLADPWRQEWEKGVQVPVSPGTIPQPVARVVSEEKSLMFIRPKKYIVSSGSEPPELGYVDIRTLADSVCRYDLNDMDAAWLELTNEEFKEMGMPELDEYTMERVLEEFEQRCYDNMNHAIETEEGLGIEYDEDVVCDVCQSPDGEDGNEMVFCDKCNICVHQVSIGSPEKMEPITKVSHIPSSRWALVCSLCNEKFGASIQVRNLTYMVTRREKIKRSVCKVQEQIFNLYTKLLEQERVSGAPPSSSSSSLENMLLFNSPSVGPDAPKIEDLKWHSAFFRKQMGTSLVHSMKKPHKRDPLQNSAGSEGKTLLKQPDLGSRREGMVVPESFLSFEKTFAEARLISAQQKNGVVMPDHGNRRDHRFHCDLGKGDLKDRPFKQSHKPLRSTDMSQRHVDNTRAATSPGVGQSAPGTRKETVPKCNGSLIKVNYNQTAVKVPTTPASPVKNWGGFRIPKKGERQQQGEAHEGACHQHSDYPYLGLGRVPAKERAKSKLKSDNENDGYVPDVEMSDSESEASEKKCIHASSTINRRTDIIRRSILAS